ncbi:MAG: ATP-binding protein [Candidatus Magasanikbacteria bacterium]
MIKRFYNDLDKWIKPGKALIIYGPRRAGKTTLLRNFLATTKYKYKLDSGDNISTQQILSSRDFKTILGYVEGYELLAIDEAQNIPDIGFGLKILTDERPDLRIIATGSSSFDLSRQVGEPLTGRKNTVILYPFAQMELLNKYNHFELKQNLADFLIFGSYPEVVMTKNRIDKITLLEELMNSYLLKDILSLEKVKGSKVLLDLVKLLAFQIGNEVSLNEMASQLSLDVKTVARYLDLLEKSFVIISLGGYGSNLRKEVSTKKKYYFLDTGIRNVVISQFNSLEDRNDIGFLWENFIAVERLKNRSYNNIYGGYYFWRTYEQEEIDLVEDRDGKLFGSECKWSAQKGEKTFAPKTWTKEYPKAGFKVITPENYLDFIA